MLSLLIKGLKFSFLAALILLLGSMIEIGDKSITDHVQAQYAQAKRTEVYQDLSKKVREQWGRLSEKTEEELLPTEREKLQKFLLELGSTAN